MRLWQIWQARSFVTSTLLHSQSSHQTGGCTTQLSNMAYAPQSLVPHSRLWQLPCPASLRQGWGHQ